MREDLGWEYKLSLLEGERGANKDEGGRICLDDDDDAMPAPNDGEVGLDFDKL